MERKIGEFNVREWLAGESDIVRLEYFRRRDQASACVVVATPIWTALDRFDKALEKLEKSWVPRIALLLILAGGAVDLLLDKGDQLVWGKVLMVLGLILLCLFAIDRWHFQRRCRALQFRLDDLLYKWLATGAPKHLFDELGYLVRRESALERESPHGEEWHGRMSALQSERNNRWSDVCQSLLDDLPVSTLRDHTM
jgi:hypothetical protein